MELTLYRCKHCGNVAFKAVDSGVPLVCCGEKMEAMMANNTDAAVEKHVPAITREGGKVRIQVGEVVHPMLPEHWIQLIAAVHGDAVTFRMLTAGSEPVLELTTDEDVTAYELCNLHGFWTNKK